jgi:hypothetical protein
MPVILATWEAQVEGSQSEDTLGKVAKSEKNCAWLKW